jgi:hypothetical protein
MLLLLLHNELSWCSRWLFVWPTTSRQLLLELIIIYIGDPLSSTMIRRPPKLLGRMPSTTACTRGPMFNHGREIAGEVPRGLLLLGGHCGTCSFIDLYTPSRAYYHLVGIVGLVPYWLIYIYIYKIYTISLATTRRDLLQENVGDLGSPWFFVLVSTGS